MTRLEIVASEPHYYEHLKPLVDAIDGAVFLTGNDRVAERAAREGCPVGRPSYQHAGPPVLVAAWKDATRVPGERRLALLEHGAGQGYEELRDHPGYQGGAGWERLSLVLTPGPHASARWSDAYPELTIAELKGSPRLDAFVGRGGDGGPQAETPLARPTVTLSFHWACHLVQEAGATWREWVMELRDLVQSNQYHLLGHAHPRAWTAVTPIYRRLGITPVPTFTQVLDLTDLYVCDNSSTMYEFAALDRPVLCLDSDHYRRDVEHGLRFWDAVPGLRCQHGELPRRIHDALADLPEAHALREHAAREAYGGMFDGHSTERAVIAIEEWLAA